MHCGVAAPRQSAGRQAKAWEISLTADQTGSEGPVGTVFRELHKRARSGFRHAPFKMAFWVGLVFAGGMGIWLEVYKLIFDPEITKLDSLRTAISTFFPAVIGATSLQMAFEDELKANRGVAVCAAFVLLIVFMMMADRHLPDGLAFPLGILASLASLWTWCAANGNSRSFQEIPNTAAIGDLPLDAPLAGGQDLAGLKH